MIVEMNDILMFDFVSNLKLGPDDLHFLFLIVTFEFDFFDSQFLVYFIVSIFAGINLAKGSLTRQFLRLIIW